METWEKIGLLQELSVPEQSTQNVVSRYYNVLEKIGALKTDYVRYMTTAPVYVEFELKRTQKASYELCCALLTMLLREDYFSNGAFRKRFQAGEVEKIIKRMLLLLKEEGNREEEVEWISEYENYDHDRTLYGKVRYILGTRGEKPLIVVGANPSAAVPEYPDRTVSIVRNLIERDDKFDSFVIINLYPQRATDPKELHRMMDKELHKRNCTHISEFLFSLKTEPIVMWAAWGSLIHQRPYLLDCLDGLLTCISGISCEWVQRGNFENPHHPLYLKKETPFQPFDVDGYVEKMKHK